MLTYIDWQPSLEAFQLGSFTVRWYSLCWCVGLLLAYVIVQRLYKQQRIEASKFEPLFFYCFIGVLVGARLGHCLFYEPEVYLISRQGFVEMLLPIHYDAAGDWHFTGYTGLASHGGTIGLFVALLLYVRRMKVNIVRVLDNVAIATPVTACLIRLGNLMNSEIIGKPTDVAWAFIFHGKDALVNGIAVPRHPAQLYEAIAYLVIFFIGVLIYRSDKKRLAAGETSGVRVGTGFYFGFCLTAIFLFRFFIEFLKKEQVDFEQGMALNMGQLLSVPMVAVGIYCMVGSKWLKRLAKSGS